MAYKITYKGLDSRETDLEIIKAFEALGYTSDGWEQGVQIDLIKHASPDKIGPNHFLITVYLSDHPEYQHQKSMTATKQKLAVNKSTGVSSYGDWVKFPPEELEILYSLGFKLADRFTNSMDQEVEDWF